MAALFQRHDRRSAAKRIGRLAQWLSACFFFSAGTALAQPVPAQPDKPASYRGIADYSVPSEFVFYSPVNSTSWKFGFYAGKATDTALKYISATPWNASGDMQNVYIWAGNAVYKAVSLPHLPIDVELDFTAAYHSPDSFAEFSVTPTFRWKWFPWNNYVYTNVRVGPFGLSYATKISEFEKTQVANGHSTNLMNSTVIEWTFSDNEKSRWEVFFRLYHRCGAWGFYDDVVGGTSYLTFGYRASF